MAKAREIENLNCQEAASEGILKVLLTRSDEVTEFAKLALEKGEDAEVIHDLRVAIRRLRSAMRDFSDFLDRKRLKPLRKKLKVFASALGAVRDKDVACETLRKLSRKVEDKIVAKTISSLIEEEISARRELFETFLSELPDQISDLEKLFREFEFAVKPTSLSFAELGKRVISTNLEEFLLLSQSFYKPFGVDELHRLRIVGKRLRYSIELFSICYDRQRADAIAYQVAEMQGILGELHDADIWIDTIGQRLKEGKIEETSGIWILSEFVKHRDRSYRKALELWANWLKKDFVKGLKEELLR
ncbi:MAG: CHAD domain-containing protein [Pyrinomonadaceae bacterium]|nr:CHAD domain-containing protein [Pyrinomonadaceae bacterium]MCX7639979.1 CHAD domain-containing protein [Pyrinomonadaceae bacterium]MDW8304151.1 CHAD domain-containing protein [Acidobacteriota bacterium]